MVTDRNVYTEEIERHKAEITSLLTLLADTRTENMRLRAALEAWNDAVLVNVVMEGPRYAGTHWKRAEAAWEKTRAALNGEEGRT